MHSVVVECDGWSKVFDISLSLYHYGRFDLTMPSVLCAAYLPGTVQAAIDAPARMTAYRTSRSVNNMTIFEVR